MLPPETVARLLKERDLVGLVFREGSEAFLYVLEIVSQEAPNNLLEFSLGSATALAAAGTAWSEIQTSASANYLEPADDDVLYQVFYGISPSYAWIYRQYPPATDRGSLRGTRAIGDQHGYVSGRTSPLNYPSPVTETIVVKGQNPAFLGYHPYASPASVTIRMNFYVHTYGTHIFNPASLTQDQLHSLRKYTMGGRTLMSTPKWLQDFGLKVKARV